LPDQNRAGDSHAEEATAKDFRKSLVFHIHSFQQFAILFNLEAKQLTPDFYG
jgi:hypothetical protein